jgi:hypothetical protein
LIEESDRKGSQKNKKTDNETMNNSTKNLLDAKEHPAVKVVEDEDSDQMNNAPDFRQKSVI